MLKSLFYGIVVGAVVAMTVGNVRLVARQDSKIEKLEQCIRYHAASCEDDRMAEYLQLIGIIGEVYGLETEDEMCRLIYWTKSITNGTPFAERRAMIRVGLDGKKEAK